MTGKSMIVLVSEQPMPNLLTAIDSRLEVREVVLVESARMSSEAERLQRVLAARGIAVRRCPLDDAYDPEPCRALVGGLLSDEPGRFIVNVTGGTKVMAMGAYLAAVENGVSDIIYLDHAQGLARWLSSGSRRDNRPAFEPQVDLALDEVLTAHGFDGVPEQRPDQRHVAFAHRLLLEATPTGIAALNALTQKALEPPKKRFLKPLSFADLTNPPDLDAQAEARRWLVEADKAGLCQWDGEKVTFKGTTPCKMVGGMWLELAVWDAMRRIRGRCGLSEPRVSVGLTGRDGIKNEIDVLSLRGGTLYMIECKTAKLHGKGKVNPDEIFYKFDHLRRIGGLKTRLAFVSVHSLGESRKRFEERDIHIIEGDSLRSLDDALSLWVMGGDGRIE